MLADIMLILIGGVVIGIPLGIIFLILDIARYRNK